MEGCDCSDGVFKYCVFGVAVIAIHLQKGSKMIWIIFEPWNTVLEYQGLSNKYCDSRSHIIPFGFRGIVTPSVSADRRDREAAADAACLLLPFIITG